MKKLNLISLLTAPLLVSGLGGCSNNVYTIGVLLPIEHNALQLAEKGFIEGLEESGLVKDKDFKINEKNAGGDEATLQSSAKDLVASSNMTLGLATGAAQALKSSSVDKGITNPIMFTAVTDPVEAKLVDSMENGKGFVTGASDAQPVAEQIALIKECIPGADKIGIIYTQSEVNSVVQADQAEAAAKAIGLSVSRSTVTGASDISSVALALASEEGMDAIYIPTDNNIAANMNAIKEACNSKNVLSMCGEFGEVKTGGHISFSFDYEMLGKETGKMAAQIIKGEKKASELPILTMGKEQCSIAINSVALAGSTITLPESVLNKAQDLGK